MSYRPAALDQVLPVNYRNPQWLLEYADDIYTEISNELKDPEKVNRAIDTLLIIFPSLLDRDDLKRWGRLVKDAYKAASSSKNDILTIDRDDSSVFTVFIQERRVRPTKRRRRERIDAGDVFETYLILYMTQLKNRWDVSDIDQDRIYDLLKFSRRVNNPYLIHKVYQTIAVIYAKQRKTEQSIDYARMAWSYWATQEDAYQPTYEMALTAHTIANAYMVQEDWPSALHWLDTSADLFAQTESKNQYVAVDTLRGSIHIWMQEYAVGEQILESTLSEITDNTPSPLVASAQHTLAIAKAYLGKHDEALDYLESAYGYAEQLDDVYRLAEMDHLRAFIVASQGNQQEATSQLQSLEQRVQTMTDSKWKTFMLGKVQRLMLAIENGENLEGLNPST